MDHIHKDTFCLTSLIAIHLTVVSMIALVCLSNARIALQAKHSYNYRIRHACTTSDIRPDHQGRGQHRSIHVADHFSNASQQGCNTHLKFLEKMPLHHRHQRVLRISLVKVSVVVLVAVVAELTIGLILGWGTASN